MAANPEQIVQIARSRNKSIPGLLKRGIFFKRNQLIADGVRVMAIWSVRKVNLIGEDNIVEAEKKVKAGEIVTVIANHKSDVDHTAAAEGLRRKGFGRFARRFVFPGGLKMLERTATRLFMGAEHLVAVGTPFDFDNARIVGRDLPSGPDKSEVIEYGKKLLGLTRYASKILGEFSKKGAVTFVYPEATRSRSGKIIRPHPAMSNYFNGEGWTLPMMTAGIEGAFPAEKKAKWWKRSDIWILVGSPVENSTIKMLSSTPEMKTLKATAADIAMSYVAELNIKKVDPQYQEFYQNVIDIRRRLLAA